VLQPQRMESHPLESAHADSALDSSTSITLPFPLVPSCPSHFGMLFFPASTVTVTVIICLCRTSHHPSDTSHHPTPPTTATTVPPPPPPLPTCVVHRFSTRAAQLTSSATTHACQPGLMACTSRGASSQCLQAATMTGTGCMRLSRPGTGACWCAATPAVSLRSDACSFLAQRCTRVTAVPHGFFQRIFLGG
jgi:hypothetical protein